LTAAPAATSSPTSSWPSAPPFHPPTQHRALSSPPSSRVNDGNMGKNPSPGPAARDTDPCNPRARTRRDLVHRRALAWSLLAPRTLVPLPHLRGTVRSTEKRNVRCRPRVARHRAALESAHSTNSVACSLTPFFVTRSLLQSRHASRRLRVFHLRTQHRQAHRNFGPCAPKKREICSFASSLERVRLSEPEIL